MALQEKSSTVFKSSQASNQESWHVSTWAQRAWYFCAGCAAVIFSIAKSLLALTSQGSRSWLHSMLAAMVAYFAVDLATGIYHWAIDNYGSAQTPIFGSQIEGFQGHHQQPWAITKRQLANNLHIAAAAVAASAIPVNLLCSDPVMLLFAGVFAGCINLPPLGVALQDAGIIVMRAEHAAHHRPPYNSNYCIVSGVWNRVLDKSKFFVAVLVVLGHKPRSWSDPTSNWGELMRRQ